LGPFRKGTVMNPSVLRQIDPAVFIDDDGQAYYVWGQFSAKMAKLKPGMMEIDENTIKDGIVTEKEHFFHEGGYLVKRNGTYYFIYAHMGRANRPTCIGYAMASNVWGPYRYGGVIIDNDHCDPAVWNNHGSIVQFNGKWYVFYHRSTHASNTMRKACLEPITFNEDGTINEVEMTSQGAGPPLVATNQIDAERACLLFGNTRIIMENSSNEILSGIRNDDKAAYKYVDFGTGIDSVLLRVRSVGNGGVIDVGIDQPWGKSVGQVHVPPHSKDWMVISTPVKKTEGVHAVWLRFYGKDDVLFEVDWLRFK
ncbi:MAG TPA: family 43 glycosylhydrolase, partial [Bacteroidales bacterium]|nr:family 43 glycosylhydrolase [Bacteroidales bacterium]